MSYASIMPFISLVFALILSTSAVARVTNVVNIADLAACGSGETNGWTLVKLDSYSEKNGKANIRFAENGDYAISKDFQAPISEILLKVKCSETHDRRLAFIPYVGTNLAPEFRQLCDYSPTKDTYVEQTLVFSNAPAFSRFKIAYDEGAYTAWGIAEMEVVTDDNREPYGLQIDRVTSSRVRLSWHNASVTSSCQLVLKKISQLPASEGLIERKHTFDELSAGGNPKKLEEFTDLPEIYSLLSGTYLYAPTNMPGVLQVSTRKDRGELQLAPFDSYENLTLAITMKPYPGDKTDTDLSVISADGLTTNKWAEINGLGTDFELRTISLTGIDGGASLVLNRSGEKTMRRLLIDEIKFLRGFSPGGIVTGIVQQVTVAGKDHSFLNLDPNSDYLVCLGNEEVSFRTDARSGFLLSVR